MFESFNDCAIGKYFKLNERGSNLTTEFRGAAATFLSMAYILAVNPRILADSGGPCDPDDYPAGGIFSDGYAVCMEDVKKQFITATAIVSIFGEFRALYRYMRFIFVVRIKLMFCVSSSSQYITGTLLMGLTANLPIALSCGMGMNAYFTYDVVGWRGTGDISYNQALTAILIEGCIFFVLAVTGIRGFVVKLIPECVRFATPAGIGFFLVHLGLQTAEGQSVSK